MHSKNLGVVFAPTIMRDRTGSRDMVDMLAKNNCVKFLIDQAGSLFQA